MNRVTKRTWLMGLFLAVLLAGIVLFLAEYAAMAPKWIMAPGSPHVYHNGNLGCGMVVDRWGEMLLDLTEERTYSPSAQIRKSTLHWVGDRKGFISAAAVSQYAGALTGYDIVDGVYNYSGIGGTEVLTLSSRIQNKALSLMSGRKGTVAVYNYRTGEILCAVTSPTFDPDFMPDIDGDTTGAYTGVYLNRFLQSAYPPGSIYKIVTCAAALDCVPGIENMTFTCYGKREYGKEAVTCETAHGTLTLKGALAHSCNCAFAQVAELVGRKNMVKYVQQFQVSEPLQFDGVTTAKGYYDVADTGMASFAWSCIGQHSDLINPCRYMAFMGAIAGGGRAAKPYLVAQVRCEDEITYQAGTELLDRAMSENLAQTMQQYLRNNVVQTYGSWHFPEMTVCGKSGTAQLSGNQTSNAMFSGFVTDAKYPLAFVVVVENGGYGASVCIPILEGVLAECKSVLDME